MDWKVTDRVTHTCDSGEEASSWEISHWDEVLRSTRTLLEGLLEIELGNQVPVQKSKLAAKSNSIRAEIKNLLWEDALSKLGGSSGGKFEKTLKEKCLEAVEYWWRTAREVCCQVYPGLGEGSLEEKRSVKSVSMCLMRLTKNKSEKFVECDQSGEEYKYRILPSGMKRLLFYREDRVRAGRKKLLHGLMENIVKLNKELVPEIETMRKCNSAAIALLENADQSRYFQRVYGEIVGMLTRQIVECQRAMIEDNDDLRISVLKQSTDALLQLYEPEVEMTETWRLARDQQKWLKSQIAQRESELEDMRGKK